MHQRYAMIPVIALLSAPSSAALVARLPNSDGEYQAYYDTALNITWTADANLSASNTFGISGIGAAGEMDWITAQEWITAMNAYGGSGYLGYNNWRLPNVSPVNGVSFNYAYLGDGLGTTDRGYNIGATGTAYAGSTASEFSYMYYTNLGNVGQINTNGEQSGCFTYGPVYCLTNFGSFSNIQSTAYWFGNPQYSNSPDLAWTFFMGDGFQTYRPKSADGNVWAVADGDVFGPAAVPVPAAAYLLYSGLVGLIGLSLQRRQP